MKTMSPLPAAISSDLPRMNAAVLDGTGATLDEAWDKLDRDLFKGVTKSHVQSWLKTYRSAHHARPATIPQPTLQDLRILESEFGADEAGPEDPLLMSLTGSGHLITGPEVKAITQGAKPKVTVSGTPYAFCFPGTTLRLFSRVTETKQKMCCEIVSFGKTSPVTKQVCHACGWRLGSGHRKCRLPHQDRHDHSKWQISPNWFCSGEWRERLGGV